MEQHKFYVMIRYNSPESLKDDRRVTFLDMFYHPTYYDEDKSLMNSE